VNQFSSKWRNVGLILLALQVLLALALVIDHQRSTAAIPSPPDPADWDLPVPDMALTILNSTERADEIARSWRADASLSFASMQIDWPTDPPPDVVTSVSAFGWLRLVYIAPIDQGEHEFAALSLLFERVSGALVNTSVSGWSSGPPGEPLLSNISVTDETAVLAAEVSGGTEFRSACPDKRGQSGVALTVDPVSGERIWSIVYRDTSTGNAGPMRVAVNAVTGEVETLRAGTATCPP
jgi:hypothetical protein